MNKYINKLSRLYIEQINYLSGPLLQDHILSYFPNANRVDPDQAALCGKGLKNSNAMLHVTFSSGLAQSIL